MNERERDNQYRALLFNISTHFSINNSLVSKYKNKKPTTRINSEKGWISTPKARILVTMLNFPYISTYSFTYTVPISDCKNEQVHNNRSNGRVRLNILELNEM